MASAGTELACITKSFSRDSFNFLGFPHLNHQTAGEKPGHYPQQCGSQITFWNMQSCGNVLDTSSLITFTLASLLDGGSVVAER